MFYHFKKIPIYIDNNLILANDITLSQNIKLLPNYKNEQRVSDNYLNNGPIEGKLNIKYYLTGNDPIKKFIYSKDDDVISGNVGGLLFNNGYLSNYSIPCNPNSPIEVSATILFFDALSGNFTENNPLNINVQALNFSNVSINNLSSYTENILDNIIEAKFNYSSNISPVYKVSNDNIILNCDKVNIENRNITTDILCDSNILSIPLSGEKFGVIFNFNNTENFGCSGVITNKLLTLSNNAYHNTLLSVIQHNSNRLIEMSGMEIDSNNSITLTSSLLTHPFTNNDNNNNSIDTIKIGEIFCNDFSVIRNNYNDIVTINPPEYIADDYLTIFTNYGNFTWPNKLNFNYDPITITGLSSQSGTAGTLIYISGTNFSNISDVYIGDKKSEFQIINNSLILGSVPYNASTDYVKIISYRRGISGESSSPFFHEPKITVFSPITGYWKDQIIIGGQNFSGVTSVKFNDIDAYSYSLISENIISANAPETGNGYAGGYIKVQTSGGLATSPYKYSPSLPIYNISGISGAFGDFVRINLKIDTGYLSISGSDWVKINFGTDDTYFKIESSGSITGQVPQNAKDGYIYVYRPDGISKYQAFSQSYNIIGEPSIYSINYPPGTRYNQYFLLTIYGKNLQFFNKSSSNVKISGFQTGLTFADVYTMINTFTGNNLIKSNQGDVLFIPNAISTGEAIPSLTVIVQNDYGTASKRLGSLGYFDNIALKMSSSTSNSTSLSMPYRALGYGNVGWQNIVMSYWTNNLPQRLLDSSPYTACTLTSPYIDQFANYNAPGYFEFYNLNGDTFNASDFYTTYMLTNLFSVTSLWDNGNNNNEIGDTGVIDLYRGNNIVYSSGPVQLGAYSTIDTTGNRHLPVHHPFGQLYTGLTKIRLTATGDTISYPSSPAIVRLIEVGIY